MGDEDNTRSQRLGTRMNEHHAGVEEVNGHELRVEESKPSMATLSALSAQLLLAVMKEMMLTRTVTCRSRLCS